MVFPIFDGRATSGLIGGQIIRVETKCRSYWRKTTQIVWHKT